MEDLQLTIEKRTREKLGNGTRIYRIVYGITILILGIIITAKTGFSFELNLAFLGEAMILIGILSMTYGLIGRKLLRQNIKIQLDTGMIRIKKKFEKEILINLDRVTYLKTSPFKLELSFEDFAKTYDFSYLTDEEFEMIKVKTIEYCEKRKIEIEE